MDRNSQSLETMIRYWVHQEEKKQQEYIQLRYRRTKSWDLIADVCGKEMRKRDIVENRFSA